MYQASCLWHQDRFIPAIKFFYYIDNVEIDPTEFCIKSHVIDEQFMFNAKVTTFNLENNNENNHGEKLYNFDGYKTKKIFAKANSLVLASTHALHRRAQSIGIEGTRKFIGMGYYNSFTRVDLLKKLFN